jgi:chemotaxis protein histidine kinase CheA
MSGPGESAFAEAINRLWEKYFPQMEERVATLQQAAEKVRTGELTENEQQKAATNAHKLAGVLGTFGLTDGTHLAREAENLYENSGDKIRLSAARLAVIAGQLQAMIAGRK